VDLFIFGDDLSIYLFLELSSLLSSLLLQVLLLVLQLLLLPVLQFFGAVYLFIFGDVLSIYLFLEMSCGSIYFWG
jgi:hypothetical protein